MKSTAEGAADDNRGMHRIVVDDSSQISLLNVFKDVLAEKQSGMSMEQSISVTQVVELIRDGFVAGTKLVDWDKLASDGSINADNAPIVNFMGNMSQEIKDAITDWIDSEAAIRREVDTETNSPEEVATRADRTDISEAAMRRSDTEPSSAEGVAVRTRRIDKKDVMAQLRYRPFGNPVSTSIQSTISNCFPGLEMDFRGVWQRLLRDDAETDGLQYDWVLHETLNAVLEHNGQLFAGRSRIGVTDSDGTEVQFDSDDYSQGQAQTDRFNRLSRFIHDNSVDTQFLLEFRQTSFNVRLNQLVDESTGYIKRPQAGELTHGLCSPWQRDFRDCGCVYWSANRPDFVNVTTDANGDSTGENWMSDGEQMDDSGTPVQEYLHEDLFDDWQGKLAFVVKGKTTS